MGESINNILGENLLTEILSRLAIEDMAVSTCVCRSWNGIVKEASFVDAVCGKVTAAETVFQKDPRMFCEMYYNNSGMRLINFSASSIAKGMQRKALIIRDHKEDLVPWAKTLAVAYYKAVDYYSATEDEKSEYRKH
ncbi:hypothetical protein G2W53_023062 [Senna tora]|uniref:F-box domain-containing protein n=1 Tax=Senna tora TaxID=362788 RepID=A0A834TMA6_9FABA|nr:hypothetical protein G2W53_023062 [Senna tora]